MHTSIQVITTTETKAQAEAIARALVERRDAACVQIVGPITSIYRWQGKIETSEEWRCEAKSRQESYARIEATIRGLHPYQVPEIIALPIVAGSPEYLRWLEAETKDEG